MATAEQPEAPGDADRWSAPKWIESLAPQLAKLLSDVVAPSMGQQEELEFLTGLGREETPEKITQLLSGSNVLGDIAVMLHKAAQDLAQAKAVDGADFSSKFQQDTFELAYGGLDTFYGGLEKMVGTPSAKLLLALYREHCRAKDSKIPFTTPNYGVNTTSETEFRFVFDPEGLVDPEVAAELDRDDPDALAQKLEEVAQGLRAPEGPDDGTAHAPGTLSFKNFKKLAAEKHASPESRAGLVEKRRKEVSAAQWPMESAEKLADMSKWRQAQPLIAFRAELLYVNALLVKTGEPGMMVEEFIGGRLYTGPMFVKYNGHLRSYTKVSMMLKADTELNQGNKYVTTLHTINSSLVKLSKILPATKVFRGMAGGRLPDSFWLANQCGVRGGVEFGFMSSTTDREVALHYAAGGGGTVFEIQLGMIDRGADLGWLSQYPHEAEICFGPLSGLEVMRTRVEASVLVVEVKLNVNLASLTIEQVMSKRKKVVLDMVDNLVVDIQKLPDFSLLQQAGLEELVSHEIGTKFADIRAEEPQTFNDDRKLQDAIDRAFKTRSCIQETCIPSLFKDEAAHSAVTALGYSASEMRALGLSPAAAIIFFGKTTMTEAGWSAEEVLAAGVPLPSMKDAGWSVGEMIEAGVPLRAMVEAGYTATQVLRAGVSPESMSGIGFGYMDLKIAGVYDD